MRGERGKKTRACDFLLSYKCILQKESMELHKKGEISETVFIKNKDGFAGGENFLNFIKKQISIRHFHTAYSNYVTDVVILWVDYDS